MGREGSVRACLRETVKSQDRNLVALDKHRCGTRLDRESTASKFRWFMGLLMALGKDAGSRN